MSDDVMTIDVAFRLTRTERGAVMTLSSDCEQLPPATVVAFALGALCLPRDDGCDCQQCQSANAAIWKAKAILVATTAMFEDLQ